MRYELRTVMRVNSLENIQMGYHISHRNSNINDRRAASGEEGELGE